MGIHEEMKKQREKVLIIEIKAKRIPDKLALAKLKASGFPMTAPTLYARKKEISADIEYRAKALVDDGILDQHLDLIDDIAEVVKGLKKDILEEEKPHNRARIRTYLIDAREALSIAMDDAKLIYEDIAESKFNIGKWTEDVDRLPKHPPTQEEMDISARRAEYEDAVKATNPI